MLSQNEIEMLECAKLILNELHNIRVGICLGGSLALKLQGFDVGRECHDIDIISNSRADNLWIPSHWKARSEENLSQLESAPFIDSIYGFDIDVLQADTFLGETRVVVDGIECDSVRSILTTKLKYITDTEVFDVVREKHISDIFSVLNALKK